MSDRTPTRFNRLQAGDQVTSAAGDIEAFGETVLSQQVTLTAANTANNPATFAITGIFQTDKIKLSHTSALTTSSALAVRVGLGSDVTAYADLSVSAGAANEIQVVDTPATSRTADWISTGSAAATTTVQCVHSAASVRADLSAQVTFNYIVRG